ncbi:MAG TPA: hypothetical protein VKR58_14755 [Aquella sp.]|nr:hypothetical protein [Aquella sp.]
MSKLVIIDSSFAWKINKVDDKFLGQCGRLGLKLEADTIQELMDLATTTMYNLFKDQYHIDQLNNFAFKHSTAWRVKDFDGYIELPVPVIFEE